MSHIGTESCHSLEIGESYYQPLRTTSRKIRITYPSANKNIALACGIHGDEWYIGPRRIGPIFSSLWGIVPFLKKRRHQTRSPQFTRASGYVVSTSKRNGAPHGYLPAKEGIASLDAAIYWSNLSTRGSSTHLKIEGRENHVGEWIVPYEVVSAYYSKKLLFVRSNPTNGETIQIDAGKTILYLTKFVPRIPFEPQEMVWLV